MDVPIHRADGTVEGWESITEPDDLHAKVMERNRHHLHQASPTPFGHGEGFDLLHGDNRHHVAEKILDGTLEWEHPMEEVNEWVQQLRRAFKEDELQAETEAINKPITVEEFRRYFKNKDESTKSSPSGRHIGHF